MKIRVLKPLKAMIDGVVVDFPEGGVYEIGDGVTERIALAFVRDGAAVKLDLEPAAQKAESVKSQKKKEYKYARS